MPTGLGEFKQRPDRLATLRRIRVDLTQPNLRVGIGAMPATIEDVLKNLPTGTRPRRQIFLGGKQVAVHLVEQPRDRIVVVADPFTDIGFRRLPRDVALYVRHSNGNPRPARLPRLIQQLQCVPFCGTHPALHPRTKATIGGNELTQRRTHRHLVASTLEEHLVRRHRIRKQVGVTVEDRAGELVGSHRHHPTGTKELHRAPRRRSDVGKTLHLSIVHQQLRIRISLNPRQVLRPERTGR